MADTNTATASDKVEGEVIQQNANGPAVTTTTQIESGNTVVQPLGTAQGQSASTPAGAEAPTQDPTATQDAEVQTQGADSAAQNEPEHALQNAKQAASKMHMLLQNVGNAADAPFRELRTLLNDLATHIYKL